MFFIYFTLLLFGKSPHKVLYNIVPGLVAGSMYARRYFNEEAKEVMLEMFRYLKESFSNDILQPLDWMDEKTKGIHVYEYRLHMRFIIVQIHFF